MQNSAGVRANGTLQHASIFGTTQVNNNRQFEIHGSSTNFPRFYLGQNNSLACVKNTVNQTSWLFYSTNSPSIPINAGVLLLDTSNPNRFFPNLNTFSGTYYHPCNCRNSDCDLGLEPERLLFDLAMYAGYEEDFESALGYMKEIIALYPHTYEAINAVAYIPIFYRDINGLYQDIIAYLEGIRHENLHDIKQKTIAMTRMFYGDYRMAHDLFSQIRSTYTDFVDIILTELTMAYCYYRIVESGMEAIPPNAVRRPQNIEEYFAIHDEIMAIIMNINVPDRIDTPPKELVEEFIINNFPNPFNPETTISFTLPNETNVEINVYNVRGQKVLDGSREFGPGMHSVVWNGRDDYGNPVGSGVYFYRLISRNADLIRNMLLLK
jgi:hypothetical protein